MNVLVLVPVAVFMRMFIFMSAARAVDMGRRMRPVTVIVVMPMAVIVALAMRMMLAVVIAMIVTMRRRGAADVGAAFGIERRLDRDDLSAEAFDHLLDDDVAPYSQALAHQFGRQMAIAEMPCDAGQGGGVGRADFRKRLGRRDDLDDAPVLKFQSIARAKQDRLLEFEQEGEAAHARHGDAPTMSLIEI